MGKRKANTKRNTPNSQVEEDVKSNKKECISNSHPHSQASFAPQVNASSSSSANAGDELVKAQAALKALESRFAQVVAENQALQIENKQIPALRTENRQLKAQLARHKQESSRSRALVHDLTFEVDDLKTELAFFRLFFLLICLMKQTFNIHVNHPTYVQCTITSMSITVCLVFDVFCYV